MHVWYVDKKWTRIPGIARHKVCMAFPISPLFEQNPPPFPAESAGPYTGHIQLRSLNSDPKCWRPQLARPWRPGSGTNAAGRTHVHIQWCNGNWSRAPALHFGSEFSERNCSKMHALLVLKQLASSWMSRWISVTCWTICYWSYQLAVGKCISHPLHYPFTLHNNNYEPWSAKTDL